MTPSIKRVPSSGAVEHGYPEGHLGHLTAEQEQALKGFKALLTEKGLYMQGPPPSHEDHILLRFLRARKWVVQDAYGQFSDTEAFRKANQIDVLYDTIDIEAYETSKKLYPMFTGRRDRRGIPIYVYQVRHLDSSTVAKYEKSSDTTYSNAKTDGKTPAKLLRLFALYENLTRFTQPLATQCTDREYAGTPITLSTNIVDISGVSLRQFWNLKAHMQAASQLATAHYPETLDRIFIIGAPTFFSTVWGWIKRWFDPTTVSKIFILTQADVLPVLTSFIDKENIPKAYGGEQDWDFFDEPHFDDYAKKLMRWENGHAALPPGPMYWQTSDDGTRLELLAVGSKAKEHRKELVATIPKAFTAPNQSTGSTTSEMTDSTTAPHSAADTPATAASTGGTTSPANEVAAGTVNGEIVDAPVDATAAQVQKLSVGDSTSAGA